MNDKNAKHETIVSKTLSDHILSIPSLLGLSKIGFEECLAQEMFMSVSSIHQLRYNNIPNSWYSHKEENNNIKRLRKCFEKAVEVYIEEEKDSQKREKALTSWENIKKPYLAFLDILCNTLRICPNLEFIENEALVSEMIKKASFSLFMRIDWATINFENEKQLRKLLEDSQQFIKECACMEKYIYSDDELDGLHATLNQLGSIKDVELHIV
ncbi:MAG: hypothetical protein IKC24_00305 [Oscillospiraceae bacterium]|nr:hypothetical protein [Oscillospiraceae bacterium]